MGIARSTFRRQNLSDPRKTRVRSRKPFRIADVSPQKALTALAVKLDSEGGVHPGEVFRYVSLVCTLPGVFFVRAIRPRTGLNRVF